MKSKRVGKAKFRIEVHIIDVQEWYWHGTCQANGKIVCDGAEGYRNRAHAIREAKAFTGGAWPIVVIGLDGERTVFS